MRRCRRFVFALGLVVALLAPGGAAAALDRCRPQTGEDVAARSSRVVLLLGLRDAGTPHETQRLTGCSRATGRRYTLAVSPIDSLVPLDGVISLRLNGTRVVALSRAGDHIGGVWLAFARGDALRGGRLTDVLERPNHLTEYAAGPHGEIAWIADAAVHVLSAAVKSSHIVATGTDLHALHFAGAELTWRDGSGLVRRRP